MVNSARVIEKIPILLVEGKTTQPAFRNDFMRNRYQLMMLKKRNPQRFNTLALQLCAILQEIEAELNRLHKISQQQKKKGR